MLANEKSEKSANTSSSSKNKFLETLLTDYQRYNQETSRDLSYDLFKIMSIAFLKENNETLTTLRVNKEFKQELFSFVNELLQEKDREISCLVTQYNSY